MIAKQWELMREYLTVIILELASRHACSSFSKNPCKDSFDNRWFTPSRNKNCVSIVKAWSLLIVWMTRQEVTTTNVMRVRIRKFEPWWELQTMVCFAERENHDAFSNTCSSGIRLEAIKRRLASTYLRHSWKHCLLLVDSLACVLYKWCSIRWKSSYFCSIGTQAFLQVNQIKIKMSK